MKGIRTVNTSTLLSQYGKNEFDIPIPSFSELFLEHSTAPFFVFQIFCVALWCLDEYWYYSIFTLFMLVVFECTVVWQVCLRYYWERSSDLTTTSQRLKTLTEFRTMSVAPYPIQCLRDSKWTTVQTDDLLPGDIVSIGKHASTLAFILFILLFV
jgi:cation-transporting ATPase 13A1